MSDNVILPRPVWENLLHQVNFLVKAMQPLAKAYKPGKWMTAEETMEALQVGSDRLKQLRASGMITYSKPVNGKRIDYLRADIEAYKEGRIILPPRVKKAS